MSGVSSMPCDFCSGVPTMQQPPPEIAAVPPHSAAASNTMALPPDWWTSIAAGISAPPPPMMATSGLTLSFGIVYSFVTNNADDYHCSRCAVKLQQRDVLNG